MLLDATFWVFVAFVIFIAMVFRRASRTLLQALDKRAADIKNDIENARKLLEDAQKLKAEQEQRAEQAVRQAAEIEASGEETARRIREQAVQELRTVIDRREAQVMNRIALAEKAAVREVRNQVVDLAVATTRQMLRDRTPKADEPDPEVETAIQSLAVNLH